MQIFVKRRKVQSAGAGAKSPSERRSETDWITIFPSIDPKTMKTMVFNRKDFRVEGNPEEPLVVWDLAQIGEAANAGILRGQMYDKKDGSTDMDASDIPSRGNLHPMKTRSLSRTSRIART